MGKEIELHEFMGIVFSLVNNQYTKYGSSFSVNMDVDNTDKDCNISFNYSMGYLRFSGEVYFSLEEPANPDKQTIDYNEVIKDLNKIISQAEVIYDKA